MKNSFTKCGLGTKLYALTGIAVFALCSIILINKIADHKISEVEKIQVKAAQDRKNAYEQANLANEKKDKINDSIRSFMRLRVAASKFIEQQTKSAEEMFNRVASNQPAANAKNRDVMIQYNLYTSLFVEFTKTVYEHQKIRTQLVEPLICADKLLIGIKDQLETKQAEIQIDGEDLSRNEYELLQVLRDCRIAFLKLQNIQQKFNSTGDIKFIDEYNDYTTKRVNIVLASITTMCRGVNNEEFVKKSKTIRTLLKDVLIYVKKAIATEQTEKKLLVEMGQKGDEVLKYLSTAAKEAKEDYTQAQQTTKASEAMALQAAEKVEKRRASASLTSNTTALLGTVFFLALAIYIIQSIKTPIHLVIDGLNESANLLQDSAIQYKKDGQQLAISASSQAASLEETASSLEEMSTMTDQNKDHAQKANKIISKSALNVNDAVESMFELTESMVNISDASEKTHKILKTIEEIAFQTNLLALNAAVEAARAGEAGKGFAVVAQEVRNLAVRASASAKETAKIIMTTQNKVCAGKEMADKCNDLFLKVSESSNKVAELIEHITIASTEQADGIGQINIAVTDIDMQVQKSASNAEKSANAADEIKNESDQISQHINTLKNVVFGD